MAKISRKTRDLVEIDQLTISKDIDTITINDYDKTTTKFYVEANEIVEEITLKDGKVVSAISYCTYEDEENKKIKLTQCAKETSLYKAESEIVFEKISEGNPTNNYKKGEFDTFNRLSYTEEVLNGATVKADYHYDKDDVLVEKTVNCKSPTTFGFISAKHCSQRMETAIA